MRQLLALLILLTTGIATSPAADTPPVPPSVTFERDVEFSKVGGVSLQMNIARPAKDGVHPAIVCIHGGGFRAGKRESYDQLCIELATQGYVAATITYRLAPAHQFPSAVHDCKAAVRWLRANAARYDIDPKRIGAMGGSAGGHLALFLGVTAGVPEFEGEGNLDQSSAVQAVVSFSGPSDFTKSYGKSVDAAEVLPLFFGGDLTTKRREHIIGSPLNWITPNAAPTLCIHGTEDPYVAHEQAEWMVERLKAASVETELLTLPGAGHGFKGDDEQTTKIAMLAFFGKRLNPIQRFPWWERTSDDRALAWLTRQQNADGSWGDKNRPLLTGLTLLSYLGHGETPESQRFGTPVMKLTDWILKQSADHDGRLCDGDQFTGEHRIEHAVCTLALGEYFIMTKDSRMETIFPKAIQHIIASQSDTGGWDFGDTPSDDDLRLTGWNSLALRSAQLTELEIPGLQKSIDAAAKWIAACQAETGGFRNPKQPPGTGDPYRTTGIAIYSHLLLVERREPLRRSMEWMLEETEKHRPIQYNSQHADLETWLHNTKACLFFGGNSWQKWNRWFQDEIADAQNVSGSWPIPGGSLPGLQSEDSKSGEIYRTAMCLMMLEVFYRYLPTLTPR